MTVEPSVLSRAIVIWTGWGKTPWPRRDAARVEERFDQAQATRILPQVRELEAEFYESDAYMQSTGLKEIGDAAAATFRSAHPELSDDAIEALTWCYTFDYR